MISFCKYIVAIYACISLNIRFRQSVLQSVSGNQERAIDALLGMSDPDYRSEALATEAVTPQLPVTLVCHLPS